MSSEMLMLQIGAERFPARLRRDLAPRSCEQLLALLPYAGKLIQARWSGEALWSPLGDAFPRESMLPPESPRAEPHPGEILLYAGGASEPELYVPYGINRFACKAGALEGNPVLSIQRGQDRLAELGRQAWWGGAIGLRIEV